MKNVFEELCIDWTQQGKISELEDISTESLKSKENKDKTSTMVYTRQVQKMQYKCDGNIRRRKKGTEGILETIRTENLPKLMSETTPQIQEVQENQADK